jgi:two-component system, NtrC family, response regulator PilR
MASSAASDKKILYVEDNLDTSELVKAVLNGLGYDTSVAPNISEAKQVILKSPFLMFLIDVRLPDGSGIDLCRWIRESDKSTPIAVYSANPTYVTEALSAGAQAFVPKSADIDLLESTVLRLTKNGKGGLVLNH